jgi:transposase
VIADELAAVSLPKSVPRNRPARTSKRSDVKTRRGRISKQGSRLLRWALIEGISRYHGGEVLASQYHKIAKRRGTYKARVAVARKVLTLVYYGLRDGEIRCLAPAQAEAA